MANPQIVLFNTLTGTSTLVDAGDGLRQRSWLEEIPRWLKESVETTALKGLNLGRMANYPSFLSGEQLNSFEGIEITKASSQIGILAVGDASETTFGDVALTDPDPLSATYFNGTANPKIAPDPVGAAAPAWMSSDIDGLWSASSGTLVFIVNGTTFNIVHGINQTAESIAALIRSAGVPGDLVIVSNSIRIFSPEVGITSSIEAPDIGPQSVLALSMFPGSGVLSDLDVRYVGDGGPLGVMDGTEVVGGSKPQRRILPRSVSVTDGTDILTDNGVGVLNNPTFTSTGTIDYVTGAISVTFATAPGSSVNVTATWKALKKFELTDPVRIPAGGLELSILLK